MPSFLTHHGVWVALVCAAAAIVYGTFWFFDGQVNSADTAAQKYPLAAGRHEDTRPMPHLQTQPFKDVYKLHQGENEKLESYAWVDKETGWSNAQQDRIYRVTFQGFATSSSGVRCARSTDNFLIEVVDPRSWKIQLSVRMCRASWMPDVAGASGWITANAHADTGLSDGRDDFTGSFNQVTGVKWFGP